MIDPATLDAAFDEFLVHSASAQEAYKGSEGRYLQILPDGKATEADVDIVKEPGPVVEGNATEVSVAVVRDPADFGAPDAKALPFTVRTDVYESPDGFGYSVTATVVDGKDTWERKVRIHEGKVVVNDEKAQVP